MNKLLSVYVEKAGVLLLSMTISDYITLTGKDHCYCEKLSWEIAKADKFTLPGRYCGFFLSEEKLLTLIVKWNSILPLPSTRISDHSKLKVCELKLSETFTEHISWIQKSCEIKSVELIKIRKHTCHPQEGHKDA